MQGKGGSLRSYEMKQRNMYLAPDKSSFTRIFRDDRESQDPENAQLQRASLRQEYPLAELFRRIFSSKPLMYVDGVRQRDQDNRQTRAEVTLSP